MANAVRNGRPGVGSSRIRFLGGLVALALTALAGAAHADVLSFGGVEGLAVVGPNYPNLTDFTATVWAKNPSAGNLGNGVLVSQGSLGGGGGFGLYVNTAGSFFFQTRDASSAASISCSRPEISTDNTWHFFAITHDWTGKVKRLYIDGVIVAETDDPAKMANPSGSHNFAIGARCITGIAHAFALKGAVTQVSLWNRALSETEIKELMARAPSAADEGLIGYWPVDEGGGTRLYDLSQTPNILSFSGSGISWTGDDKAPNYALSFVLGADARTADFTFPVSDRVRKLFVAYGTADAGSQTNDWPNCEQIATIPAGVSSLSAVELPSGFGSEAPVMRAFIQRIPDARDYVKRNDLLAHYDAIENAGFGVHAATPTVWTDLVSGRNIALTDGDTVGANYIDIGATEHTVSGIFSRYSSDATFETSFRVLSVADSVTATFNVLWVNGIGKIGFDVRDTEKPFAFTVPKDTGYAKSVLMWWKSPYANFKAFKNSGKFVDVSFTPNFSTTPPVVYLDGTSYLKDHTYDTSFNNSLVFTLGSASASSRVRTVRIYEHTLTADERAYNRVVDQIRFEGAETTFYATSAKSGYAKRPLTVTQLVKDADEQTPVSIDLAFTGSDVGRKAYLAWAKKDVGTTLCYWENQVELGEIPAGVTSATFEVPAEIRAALVHRGYRIFLQCEASAADYITKDLLAHYDAIENAGYGVHADTPTVWTDLVSGRNIALTDGDAVGANYMDIGASAHKVTGIFSAYDPTTTMETSFRVLSVSDSVSAAFWTLCIPGIGSIGCDVRDNNKAFLFRVPWYDSLSNSTYMWWNNPYANFNAFKSSGEFADVSFSPNYSVTPPTVYLNGTSYSKSTVYNVSYDPSLDLTVGSTDASSRVRTIRIYGRELTADERAYNRAIDQNRFAGGAMAGYETTPFTKVNQFGFAIIAR